MSFIALRRANFTLHTGCGKYLLNERNDHDYATPLADQRAMRCTTSSQKDL
tara:strand:- start:323 stop:475 length:153 start_codon:yes stop_codon:yes gene_type:complete